MRTVPKWFSGFRRRCFGNVFGGKFGSAGFLLLPSGFYGRVVRSNRVFDDTRGVRGGGDFIRQRDSTLRLGGRAGSLVGFRTGGGRIRLLRASHQLAFSFKPDFVILSVGTSGLLPDLSGALGDFLV